jgi:hypothetical protein
VASRVITAILQILLDQVSAIGRLNLQRGFSTITLKIKAIQGLGRINFVQQMFSVLA